MNIPTPTPLRCLVVDDEEQAHHALIQLIREVAWLEHAGSCYSAPEAAAALLRQSADLIFLDVQLPGLTGLDLLRLLPVPRPPIILTTAYPEYALAGFEHAVADFLLKPIDPERFLRAVLKAIQILPPRWMASPPVEEQASGPRTESWLRANGKLYRIAHRDIYCVQGLKDYVKVFYREGMLVTHGNVGSMQAQLPAELFVRIHRSHLINRFAVRWIDGNQVGLENGMELAISSRYNRDDVLRQLTQT